MTVELISYDVRQMNFTPGELVGSMNTAANFLSCTGINPWWATNVWVVSTEPVATTFAPEMMRPASVSLSTWQQTSLTSFGGRSRSIGGWMMAWLMKGTRSWQNLYQPRALL